MIEQGGVTRTTPSKVRACTTHVEQCGVIVRSSCLESNLDLSSFQPW
jgi:hypothetical protein